MSEKSSIVRNVCARLGGKQSLVFVTMLVLVFSMAFYAPISSGAPPVKTIRIGVIAPWGDIEGEYTYEDWSRDFYKQIIEPDINAYLAKLPRTRFSPMPQVEFLIESAGPYYDSTVHLEMVKKFHNMGVNLIIGGVFTFQAAGSLDYVNQHDMVMISTSSTGTSLSLPNDNLFRLIPDDSGQGVAIASMLEYRGITKLVVIQQDDIWAEGIMAVLDAAYSGEITAPIKYVPYETDFAPIVDTAEELLTGDVGEGVLLLSAEADTFLLAADGHTKLMSTEWFGADYTAYSSLIYENALSQAAQVKLYSSTATMTPEAENSNKNNAMETIFKALFPNEEGLDIYAANNLDAAWLLTLAVLETQNTIPPAIDGNEIVKVLPDIASRYYGYSGYCELNENGDRMPSNYRFWGYDSLGYHLYGEYNISTDAITWFG